VLERAVRCRPAWVGQPGGIVGLRALQSRWESRLMIPRSRKDVDALGRGRLCLWIFVVETFPEDAYRAGHAR